MYRKGRDFNISFNINYIELYRVNFEKKVVSSRLQEDASSLSLHSLHPFIA